MAGHVFIDNSNIFGGAQRAAETLEPGAVWLAVRVYYPNLFKLLEGAHEIQTRVMAGSVPPGNEALWDYARKAHYKTDLLRRIKQDDGRLAEQAVDELLHLQIANALLDFEPPQTLILATGDGRLSPFGQSFELQVFRALRSGWDVEVWSWREQLSGKFARVVVPGGAKAVVRRLDPYDRQVTFVQAGTYTVRGAAVSVEGRVVDRLVR